METILLWYLVFAVIVVIWADSWGRSRIGFLAVALLLSPLVAGIILLIAGKSLKKRAEEQIAVENLKDKMRNPVVVTKTPKTHTPPILKQAHPNWSM